MFWFKSWLLLLCFFNIFFFRALLPLSWCSIENLAQLWNKGWSTMRYTLANDFMTRFKIDFRPPENIWLPIKSHTGLMGLFWARKHWICFRGLSNHKAGFPLTFTVYFIYTTHTINILVYYICGSGEGLLIGFCWLLCCTNSFFFLSSSFSNKGMFSYLIKFHPSSCNSSEKREKSIFRIFLVYIHFTYNGFFLLFVLVWGKLKNEQNLSNIHNSAQWFFPL